MSSNTIPVIGQSTSLPQPRTRGRTPTEVPELCPCCHRPTLIRRVHGWYCTPCRGWLEERGGIITLNQGPPV